MPDVIRDEILAALADVLYIDESDLTDGEATDLRDLGLDSLRFVLLMKRLGVNRESEEPARFARDLSVKAWTQELEALRGPT
ncbi:MAG: acyl carrier protein [Mycobacterium sp.]|nr:acyl carrier protein [Mycobacterium sp.]